MNILDQRLGFLLVAMGLFALSTQAVSCGSSTQINNAAMNSAAAAIEGDTVMPDEAAPDRAGSPQNP